MIKYEIQHFWNEHFHNHKHFRVMSNDQFN